jgi:hypothetical protein
LSDRVGGDVVVGDCLTGLVVTWQYLIDILDLDNVLGRGIQDLSGGELQRFAIAVVAVQKADVYMFDEPSSYLDVKQRIHACKVLSHLLDIPFFLRFRYLHVPTRRPFSQRSHREASVSVHLNRSAASPPGDPLPP